MIRARFYCPADGSIHMHIAGHAGAGVKGADLVCAGASMLACTLAGAVERMYEQQMLRRCPRVELADGAADIIAQPKPGVFQPVLMAFWTVETGIAALAESFPGNVRLEETLHIEKGENEC